MRVAVALCGLPGSGKSTLARALQAATGWCRLDRDALRVERHGDAGYTDAEKRALTQAMRDEMRARLLVGASVILDGMTFARESDRMTFERAARNAHAYWRVVWLDCAVDVARARVAGDVNHPARDRTPELVDEVARRFDAPADALQLNAMERTDVLLRAVLDDLQRLTEASHAT